VDAPENCFRYLVLTLSTQFAELTFRNYCQLVRDGCCPGSRFAEAMDRITPEASLEFQRRMM
jgi:hypothetical protein